MPNNIYLFIHGKAHSGKDTIFNSMKMTVCANDTVRMAFADEVKRELVRINPEVSFEKLLTDNEYKEKYRKELVEIGDGYRKDDPYIWIDKMKEQILYFDSKNSKKIVCITDMRYRNEFSFANELMEILAHESMSFTVKLDVQEIVRFGRMSTDGLKKYLKYGRENPSECDMDTVTNSEFDVVIDNNKHLEDEQQRTFHIFSQITPIVRMWIKIMDGGDEHKTV